MKITLTKYTNARIAAASTNAQCNFYRSPGYSINVKDVLIGTTIDGNSVWYLNDDDGCYYWSGGFEDIEFTNTIKNIDALDEAAAMQILNEAKNYYWTLYRAKDKNINGISIGDKITSNIISTKDFCLIFQVIDKNNKAAPIPKTLIYKGFEILTDVMQVSVSYAQIAQPSQSVSRINRDEWGTVGVKLKDKNKEFPFNYLLTNYHVAASDLISKNIFSFNSDESTLVDKRIIVPAKKFQTNTNDGMGALYIGALSSFFDIALLLLDNEESADNKINNTKRIDGSLDVFGNISFKGTGISLHGAATNSATAKIISVNANQIIRYNNGEFETELKELIQMERCSQAGDSGSPILIGNKIIGILVAGDDTFSYAIPITRILNFYNLKIA
jgi:hypothetical protein